MEYRYHRNFLKFGVGSPSETLLVKSSNAITVSTRNSSASRLSSLADYKTIQESINKDDSFVGTEKHLYDLSDISEESKLPRVGPDAMKRYYRTYKKLVREVEKGKDKRVPATAYQQRCDKQRILPTAIAVATRKGKESEVNIKGYSVGEDYALALGEGVQLLTDARKIDLTGNRLAAKGAKIITNCIQGNNTIELNLSDNSIGLQGASYLARTQLKSKHCAIQILNLENNKLGDEAVGEVCYSLEESKILRVLNLGYNEISDKSANALRDMIEFNQSIRNLSLKWNKLRGPSGAAIFRGLKKNETLRVLDLSWNSLGSGLPDVGRLIGEGVPPILLHLDLSYNKLSR